MAGNRQIGIDFDPTDPVALGAKPLAGRRGSYASGPDHGTRLDSNRADRHPRSSRAERPSHASHADRSDPTGRIEVIDDPLTGPGLVIITKKAPEGHMTGKRLYTPTAVGSLRIILAEGDILTLQSRQGNRFSLNVQTEELTPVGSR